MTCEKLAGSPKKSLYIVKYWKKSICIRYLPLSVVAFIDAGGVHLFHVGFKLRGHAQGIYKKLYVHILDMMWMIKAGAHTHFM